MAKSPTKLNPEDRALSYALAVINGSITAGPYVKGACQRHLNDLHKAKTDPAYPFYFDEAEAAKSIAFFEEILCLNGGQFEGLPFILLPWQAFIVGSVFGWKQRIDGYRRFRLLFCETGKGSGKTPMSGAIGIKGLLADNEPRAEIYACATLKEQAMVLFRDVIAFYEQSPELQKRLTTSGGKGKEWKIDHLPSGSFFQIISSDKKKSGPRPHMYIADEVHEHKDGTIIGLLEKGFKFHKQPLGVEITNSGFDMTSFCRERHDMGVKVACEQEQNDSVFAYICSLDEEDLKDDRYLTDKSCWIKVNPSLDAGIPGYDYIEKQITNAKGMPSQLSTVKRLNFCIWVEAENPWISGEVWGAIKDTEFDESLYEDRKCWGALDLSAVNDLTSYNLLFEPIEEDPLWRLKSFFWMPGEGLIRKGEIDHVPYDAWVRLKWLFTSDGPTISKTQVIKYIHETSLRYDIQGIAFDRDRMSDFRELATKAEVEFAYGKWDKEKHQWTFDSSSGIKMMPFGQSAKSMAPAIDKFETLLMNKEIRHNGSPVQTSCMANSVVKADEDGNRKISKRRSIGRVDGAVTAVMCCGIAEKPGEQKSAYDGLTKQQIIEMMRY